MFRQNMKGVTEEDGEFGIIPEGEYQVVVAKAAEVVTKTTGKPMVRVMLRVTEGTYKNSPIFDHIVFVEAMKGRNKHILKVLGQPHEDDFNVNAEDWVGAECRVKVRHDLYQGKKRAKVSQYKYLQETETETPPATSQDNAPAEDEGDPLPF